MNLGFEEMDDKNSLNKLWKVALIGILIIIVVSAVASGYEWKIGESNADFTRYNQRENGEQQDNSDPFQIDFGFTKGPTYSHYYIALVDNDGHPFENYQGQFLAAIQNITYTNREAVADLNIITRAPYNSRVATWNVTDFALGLDINGIGDQFNVYVHQYNPDTDGQHQPVPLPHTKPTGINVCWERGGNYYIRWSPPIKTIDKVQYQSTLPNGVSTFPRNYTIANNHTNNISYTGRAIQDYNVSLQFFFHDGTFSEKGYQVIDHISLCTPDPSSVVPVNQTVVNVSSDTGDSIRWSIFILIIMGVWAMTLVWASRLKFSEKNYLRDGEQGNVVYIIGKQKYMKVIALTGLYIITWVLAATFSNVSAEITLPSSIVNLFVVLANLMTGGLYALLVVSSLALVIMAYYDVKKMLLYNTRKEFRG